MPVRFYILWMLIAVMGRIIPHPPNTTPFTNLSLIAGRKLSFFKAAILVLLAMFFSDMLLSWLQGSPLFGYWMLFSYSGFLASAYLGRKLSSHLSFKAGFLIIASLSMGFWLWTNLGVWLLSGLYSHNVMGLLSCYLMALPFLRNALLGDLGWFLIIYWVYRWGRVPVYSVALNLKAN